MRVIPTENRDILMEMAHNRTARQYVDLIWVERNKANPAPVKARSKSWPASCYDKGERGYILATCQPSNVTPIRKKRP